MKETLGHRRVSESLIKLFSLFDNRWNIVTREELDRKWTSTPTPTPLQLVDFVFRLSWIEIENHQTGETMFQESLRCCEAESPCSTSYSRQTFSIHLAC